MKCIYRFYFLLAVLFLNIPIFSTTTPWVAQKSKTVLILNSYHTDYIWSETVSQVIRQNLQNEYKKIEIYNEYMDTKRFQEQNISNIFYQFFLKKYQQIDFDLIITNDDNAFYFIDKYHDQHFPGVPVIFVGLNYFDSTLVQDKEYITGIVERAELRPTIELIKQLHPDLNKMFVLHDNTLTGKASLKTEKKIYDTYKELDIEYLIADEYNKNELQIKLQELSRSDAIYYGSWSIDKDHKTYTHGEAIKLISNFSKAPVYGTVDIYLGHGILGGKISSSKYYGEIASQIAVKILNGIPPAEIPVNTQIFNQYMFDYKQLKQHNIALTQLPPQSIIINKPLTFFEKHGRLLRIVIAIFLIQTVFTSALLVLYYKNRRAEKALLYEEKILSSLMDNIPDAIYFKDRNHRFIKNNKAHLDTFLHKDQASVIGKTDYNFFNIDIANKKHQQEKIIFESGKPLVDHIEEIQQSDGSTKWISTTKVPIRDKDNKFETLVAVSRDITERRLKDEKIKSSLAEKEILLKEIHHRVKNNLQVISSLLNLQSANIKDDVYKDLLKESQNRIRTMALIHEKLYQSQDFTKIDFRSYVNDLVRGLMSSLSVRNHYVDFNIQIDRIGLNVTKAVPCGLVINELVTNALKHAFNGSTNSQGKISIKFSLIKSNQIELIIKDNGVGMDVNFDFSSAESLGLKLVKILVEDQLEGNLELINNQGTMFIISFALKD